MTGCDRREAATRGPGRGRRQGRRKPGRGGRARSAAVRHGGQRRPGRGRAVRPGWRARDPGAGQHGRPVQHRAGGLRPRSWPAPCRARHPSARCAGERRCHRRRERHAHDHGLGLGRSFRGGRCRARCLRQKGSPAGRSARHRLDREGGEPAARRGQPGDRGRGHGVRRGAGCRPESAVRGDQERRRRLLDVRQPRAAHAGATTSRRRARSTSGSRIWRWCWTPAGACACRCRWRRPPSRW